MIALSSFLLASDDFVPHGFCYLWDRGLVWLHVASDSLIVLAYFAIPVILGWIVRKRGDLPFGWMFWLFGLFIISCGMTHALEVWNLWHAQYWLAGTVKGFTAVASIATTLFLIRTAPEIVQTPSLQEWKRANSALEKEIRERRELETHLRRSEARYREIAELVDLTHDAIFVRDLEDRVTFWNRAAERLYGWGKEEVLGQRPHELLKASLPEDLQSIKNQIFSEGYWEGELIHTNRDGRQLVVSSRWALQTDEAGKPVAILESNRDVTHRRLAEKKFQSILEAAPDAIVITNHAGLIQIINSQAEAMFGFSRNEILGQPVETLIPGRLHQIHMKHRLDYLARPLPRPMGESKGLLARRKDGSEFPVELSLSPIKTADGLLICSAIRDITIRKQFEQRMHEQEDKLRLFVTGVVDYAVLMLDTDGRVISWNAGAERIKGYAQREIVGRCWTAFFPAEDVEIGKPQMLLKQAIEEKHCEDEGWRVRKDGSRFWAHVVITPLYDESGQLRGFGKVTRDITQRKETEEQIALQSKRLAETNTKLRQLNSELESFSYSVSHDLRAPLRAIDGLSLALLEDCAPRLDETGKEHLNRIRAATQRMSTLIDDLLNLSRITRGEMYLQAVDLSALASSIMASLQQTEPDRNVQFTIENGVSAQGDPGLLRVALENLLANAWKFTSKRALGHIEFGQISSNGSPVYYVRDDGAGFDPAYADRLFGTFQRLHSTAEFPGTGVGLATVRRIVRRHGGQIWAEGAVDKGATFSFTLNGSSYGRKQSQ